MGNKIIVTIPSGVVLKPDFAQDDKYVQVQTTFEEVPHISFWPREWVTVMSSGEENSDGG